ncbi:MAG: aldo/keto reductase [Candidatus Lokiarchaeota archaeon]|nr:aldo/keto reductase [Candidatus Lokiarchaeota archaeon]
MSLNKKQGKLAIDPTIESVDPKLVQKIKLPSGNLMPVAAYGTFHSDWAQEYMYEATVEAIRIGWRHIDTARAYENEKTIGDAIKEAISKGYINSPNDLFITGKLWNGHMAKEDVKPALENTLKGLSIEKIDLYINHWPWRNVHTPGCDGNHKNPDAVPYIHEDFMDTWAEIVKLKRAGKIVDIGTSNHTKMCMQLLLRDCSDDERPAVNQMEIHPLFQQTDLIRYFQSENIVCMGFMAMGSPHRPARDTFKEHRSDMADSTIVAIANELDVSPAKVCLNWAIQRENKSCGFVVMTTRSKYMRENLMCSYENLLSQEQLLQISGDGTPENPGIDANNRLIRGQVFLWPEADNDWRVLWDDSQVFETRKDFEKYREAWVKFSDIKKETTFQVG